MAAIVLAGVTRVHPDGTRALAGLDLRVDDGELLVITGPSGSGKTTTLRVIAGLDPVTSGTVAIGGRVVNDLPTRDRDVALVTQDHTLYPHLTVRQNLEFPLSLHHVPKPEAARRTAAEARVHGLGRLLDRLPRALSTGERQRTAVARATARTPQAFLLDEPLSALDAGQRTAVRLQLATFQGGLGITMLYVTNDQVEALALGQRVALLREGRLEQVGTPQELLDRPCSRFVAGFVGLPAATFVEVVLEEQGGLGHYRLGDQRLRIPAGLPGPLQARVGQRLVLGARPHQLGDSTADPGFPADRRLTGTVERLEPHGGWTLVHVAVPGGTLAARFPAAARPRRGSTVELTVDVARLPVFELATGVAVWHGRS